MSENVSQLSHFTLSGLKFAFVYRGIQFSDSGPSRKIPKSDMRYLIAIFLSNALFTYSAVRNEQNFVRQNCSLVGCRHLRRLLANIAPLKARQTQNCSPPEAEIECLFRLSSARLRLFSREANLLNIFSIKSQFLKSLKCIYKIQHTFNSVPLSCKVRKL